MKRPLVVLAAASMVLASCTSAPPLAGSGPGVRDATRPLEARDVFPLEPGERAFDVVSGEHAGKTLVIRLERDGDAWTRTWTIDGARAPLRVDTLRESSGALLLLETHTPGERVISRYDPPLVVLPARLGPGEREEQAVTLTVHPESDPTRTSQEGPAKQTLTLAGVERLAIGAGDFDASMVRAELDITLPGATVRRETNAWYAADSGLVAEEYREEVRILGLIPRVTAMRIEAKGAKEARGSRLSAPPPRSLAPPTKRPRPAPRGA